MQSECLRVVREEEVTELGHQLDMRNERRRSKTELMMWAA